MPTFGPNDYETLQILTSTFSSISLVSIISVWYNMYQSSEKSRNSLSSRSLATLLFFNFLFSIVSVFGRTLINNPMSCRFQGFMIQLSGLGAMLWTTVIVWSMFKWIVLRKNPDKIMTKYRRDVIITIIAATIPAVILLSENMYGDAEAWCWIGTEYEAARMGAFFAILFTTWGLTIGMLSFIRYHIYMTDGSQDTKEGEDNGKSVGLNYRELLVLNQLTAYIVIFVLCYFFALVNRVVESVTGEKAVYLLMLQVSTINLQGFLNAMVYSGVIRHLTNFFHPNPQNTIKNKENDSNYRVLGDAEVKACPDALLSMHTDDSNINFKDYSVFISTYNLGEAPLSEVKKYFKDWILPGHDVYSIGVQECMEWDQLPEALWTYLGRNEYQMICNGIGSDVKAVGYHGFIGLIVFVKLEEAKAGNIRATRVSQSTTATGTNLGLIRAANKGGVSIPLQINDLSVVFLASHLPSDEKGKNKLKVRNSAAHSIIRETAAGSEDSGFDLDSNHHLVFFTGDVNYRMKDSLADEDFNHALEAVAIASQTEKDIYDDKLSVGSNEQDQLWINRRYNLLRHPSDSQYPSFQELLVLLEARDVAMPLWKAVYENDDELVHQMITGSCFAFFEEFPLSFPPTYKRKMSIEPVFDFTDASLALTHGYSNYVKLSSVYSGKHQKAITDILEAGEHDEDENEDDNSSPRSGSHSPANRRYDSADGHGDGSTIYNDENGKSRPSSTTHMSITDIDDDHMADFKKFMKKRRAPSYTDRILYRRQFDIRQANRVQMQGYDIGEGVPCSDHKPVTLVTKIKANNDVIFPLNFDESYRPKGVTAFVDLGNDKIQPATAPLTPSLASILFPELDTSGDDKELEDLSGVESNLDVENRGENKEVGDDSKANTDTEEITDKHEDLEEGGNDSGGDSNGSGNTNSSSSSAPQRYGNLGVSTTRMSDTSVRTSAQSIVSDIPHHSNKEIGNLNRLFLFELTISDFEVSMDTSGKDIHGRSTVNPLQSTGEEGYSDSDEEEDFVSTSSKVSHAFNKTQTAISSKSKNKNQYSLKKCFKAIKHSLGYSKSQEKEQLVDKMVISFPLPSADPLLRQKHENARLQDLLNVDSNETVGELTELQQIASQMSHALHPEMKYDMGDDEVILDDKSLLKPISEFNMEGMIDTKNDDGNKHGSQTKTEFKTTKDIRVLGALVPAMGAHVCVKLRARRDRAKLGECCVSLSHLIDLDDARIAAVTAAEQITDVSDKLDKVETLAENSNKQRQPTILDTALKRVSGLFGFDHVYTGNEEEGHDAYNNSDKLASIILEGDNEDRETESSISHLSMSKDIASGTVAMDDIPSIKHGQMRTEPVSSKARNVGGTASVAREDSMSVDELTRENLIREMRTIKTETIERIPVTVGSELRGFARGKFSLVFLAAVEKKK